MSCSGVLLFERNRQALNRYWLNITVKQVCLSSQSKCVDYGSKKFFKKFLLRLNSYQE